MTPQAALREIEQMFRELNPPASYQDAIEEDIARLWEYVLLGK